MKKWNEDQDVWIAKFYIEFSQLSLNGHLVLVPAGQRTLLKPLTDNLEVLYVVKNSSKRNAGVPYDSKLQNVWYCVVLLQFTECTLLRF